MSKANQEAPLKKVFETLASRYKLKDDEVQEAYSEIIDYLYDAITDMEWLLTLQPIEVPPFGKFSKGSKIEFVNPKGKRTILIEFK